MNIKYFLTNKKADILDLLEKELCKNGISYVRIDNEVHFENTIIRILDFVEDKGVIYNLTINSWIIDDSIFSIKTPSFDMETSDDYKFIPVESDTPVGKSFPKRTKKDLKRDSNQARLLLKRMKR